MSFTTINPLANLAVQSAQLQNFAGTSNTIMTPQACANAIKNTLPSFGANSYKGYCVAVDNAFDKSGSSFAFAASGVRNSLNEAITHNDTLIPSASLAKFYCGLATAKAMELGWFTDTTKLSAVCPWLFDATNATGYYMSSTTVPAGFASNPALISNFTGAFGAFSWLDKPTVADLLRYDVGMDFNYTYIGLAGGSTFLNGEGPIGLATQGGYWGANTAFHALQYMHALYDGLIPDPVIEAATGTYGFNNWTEYCKKFIRQTTNAASNFPAATGVVQCNFNFNTYLGIPLSNANDHIPLINMPGAYAGLSSTFVTAPYGAIGVPIGTYSWAVQLCGMMIDALAFANGYNNFGGFVRSTILEPLGLYNTRFGNIDSSFSPSQGKICWTGTNGQVNTYLVPSFNRWGYGGGASAVTSALITGALGSPVTGPCNLNLFGVIATPTPYSYGMSPAFGTTFSAFLNAGGGSLIPPQWATDFPTDLLSSVFLYGTRFNPTGSADSPFTPGVNGSMSQSTGWVDVNGIIDATVTDTMELCKMMCNRGVGTNGTRVLTPASVNYLLSPKVPGNTNVNIVYGLASLDNESQSTTGFGLRRWNRDLNSMQLFGNDPAVCRISGAYGATCLFNIETGYVIYFSAISSYLGNAPSLSAFVAFNERNVSTTMWQILASYTY
jgi:hypothetical protein